MMSMGCVLGMLGCEDRMDSPVPSTGEGKPVEVTLHVGIADEVDAASQGSAPADTKAAGAGDQSGFDVRLLPVSGTKAVQVTDDPLATAKPDKLYGLQILQYTSGSDDSAPIGFINVGDQAIGTSFTGTLSDNGGNDCQLLIIARGSGGTVSSLQGKTLEAVRKIAVSSTTIDGITTAEGIKPMPYLLHLPKVKVVNDNGTTYKIQSPDGTDVRLLLRRLATRLTVAWENIPANTGYDLKQVLLRGIPAEYKLLPGNTESYPSLFDQYPIIEVRDVSDAGQYTCWIPSVIRGESAAATSDYSRTKANAPKGSVYATFISRKKDDSKQKLDYRVYLGGLSSHDFNLRENTNYIYKVTMSHTSLPVDDKRVTIIDPIPASRNNNNLVPTANCFMVAPGGAFCFNPYTYYIDGAPTQNTLLQGWCGNTGGTLSAPIKSVKVLWQTLEDGDLGDPTLGVVNNYAPGTLDDDHENIVELKNGGSLTDARIYCRVAPNTAGGSGVIAAYDGENGTGNILWSWHVWVTDYSPDAMGNQSVYEPANKRKQKYTYRCDPQYPMMDRNLGANIGFVELPGSEEEKSKANGFHYQWGRKDPFPSSYSLEPVTEITVSTDRPTKGMLNFYQPDGLSFFQRKYSNATASYSVVYKTPAIFYESWNSYRDAKWQTEGNTKNEHDPCPAGWRVASYKNYESFFTQEGYDQSTGQKDNVPLNIKNSGTVLGDGGALLYYEGKGTGRTTYFRFNGYQQVSDKFRYVGAMTNLWCREIDGSNTTQAYAFSINYGGFPFNGIGTGTANNIRGTWNQTDAHSVRCIQERP